MTGLAPGRYCKTPSSFNCGFPGMCICWNICNNNTSYDQQWCICMLKLASYCICKPSIFNFTGRYKLAKLPLETISLAQWVSTKYFTLEKAEPVLVGENINVLQLRLKWTKWWQFVTRKHETFNIGEGAALLWCEWRDLSSTCNLLSLEVCGLFLPFGQIHYMAFDF